MKKLRERQLEGEGEAVARMAGARYAGWTAQRPAMYAMITEEDRKH